MNDDEASRAVCPGPRRVAGWAARPSPRSFLRGALVSWEPTRWVDRVVPDSGLTVGDLRERRSPGGFPGASRWIAIGSVDGPSADVPSRTRRSDALPAAARLLRGRERPVPWFDRHLARISDDAASRPPLDVLTRSGRDFSRALSAHAEPPCSCVHTLVWRPPDGTQLDSVLSICIESTREEAPQWTIYA